MVIGFLLPIPGGIFAGAFLGAVAFEIIFDLKDLQEAMQSGVGALAGTLLSLFFEFAIGLAMATLIFYLLFSAGVLPNSQKKSCPALRPDSLYTKS